MRVVSVLQVDTACKSYVYPFYSIIFKIKVDLLIIVIEDKVIIQAGISEVFRYFIYEEYYE